MAPLRMARPTKRPESSSHQFRKRVPANILKRFAGQKLTIELPSATQGGQPLVVPVTLGKADIKFSLRTSDPTLAKLRTGAATEQLESRFRALRDGPKPLPHKQAVYLAGLVYRAMAAGLEDDPGTARTWEAIEEIAIRLLSKDHWRVRLSIGDEAKRNAATAELEARLGLWVDLLLRREGIYTDTASREKLLWEVARAISEAATKLKRNAGGDYRPDENAARFPPTWTPPAPTNVPPQTATGPTITGLLERWVAERNPAASTVSTYRGHVSRLVAFLSHDDATRVTSADAILWKDNLSNAGVARINGGQLATLRNLFKYG